MSDLEMAAHFITVAALQQMPERFKADDGGTKYEFDVEFYDLYKDTYADMLRQLQSNPLDEF